MFDRYLSSFQEALTGGLAPTTLSAGAAVLLEDDRGDLRVAVAKRSGAVVTANATRALIPMYGMESNVIGDRSSKYSLTFYNFVREFCEELFDPEELIQMQTARRADPDWIFELPPAQRILDETLRGELHMCRTGIGINATDGGLKTVLLMHFRSPGFFEWLQQELRTNWEHAPESTPVEFKRVGDPDLDAWASNQRLSPTSIFAIDLARDHVINGCLQ